MNHTIVSKIRLLYAEAADVILNHIDQIDILTKESKWVDQRSSFLITYGDSLLSDSMMPLQTLGAFSQKYLKNVIESIHVLPMFPHTSDDGFSVVDYYKINPELGNWDDLHSLGTHFQLMYDAVVNHISASSEWFREYLYGNEDYDDFFIECDPNMDYSSVVRPRALPLYYPFQSSAGVKQIWATFSDDQVDLNFANPKVFLAILDVLYFYAKQGATYIRLDAVGFIWKVIGTSCIHLPEAHLIIQLYREILDLVAPGTILITETNVPHLENISYFGATEKEAHMVYQFPLPPLTLFSFISGSAVVLNQWIQSLAAETLKPNTSYFNFLSSHDGIGMRPTESILSDSQKQLMIDHVLSIGGKVGYRSNPDGTKSVYELNTTFFDALKAETDSLKMHQDKMIAAHAILFAMKGVPAIYIHSLLASHNDIHAAESSGIARRISRTKLHLETLEEELRQQGNERKIVMERLIALLQLRANHPAFHPDGLMASIAVDSKVVGIRRSFQGQTIDCFTNVTNATVTMDVMGGLDIISSTTVGTRIELAPYQTRWILWQSSL